MSINIKRTAIFLALTATSALSTPLALADESSSPKLEEVIVTAQRTEQNMQDVPVAITAFTAEMIDRDGISTFQDIQHTVPNLSMVVVTPFASWVNMRGIPSNPNGVFNSGTSAGLATYVDGVVFSRPTGFNQDLANVERVEVLRGPQGTLFGQNSNLGVINVTTRKPGDELEGKLKLDVGNYEYTSGTAYISGPLIEGVLAGSLSLFKVERDGFSKNVTNGDTTDDLDRETARVQLRYTPNDKFTADLNADYLKGRSRSSNPDILEISDNPNTLVRLALILSPDLDDDDVIIPGARTVTQNSELDINKRDNDGVDLTMLYDFDNGYALKSITAQKNYDSFFGDDQDGTGLQILDLVQQEDNSQFSQELQLISPQENDLRFITGLFYIDIDSENLQAANFLEDFPLPSEPLYLEAEVTSKSIAAFAHATWDFSDNASAFLGMRYSDIEKDVVFQQDANSILRYPKVDLVDTVENDFVSWTVGVSYDFEESFGAPLIAYAKVSRGYKEGGFTVRFVTVAGIGGDVDNPDISFDEEEVTSYEVGLKGTLLDQRLRTNLAVFYLDYKDIQATVFEENSSAIHITNGPEATSQGAELEVTYLLNEYFTFRANIGYVDAKYGDFDNCNRVLSCSGNKLPRSPEWTNNFALSAIYPLANGWELFSSLDYSYRSESYLSAPNTELLEFDVVEQVNFYAGVLMPEYGMEIQAYVKNATDEDYVTSMSEASIDRTYGTTGRRYGPPRTYGVRLTYRF
ncbi:MAG: TonB-dependent receptor [Halioglobus sp.]